eukprot:1076363-Pelagomonas_calceolata.AAC.2
MKESQAEDKVKAEEKVKAEDAALEKEEEEAREQEGQLRPSLRQARKPCPLAARIKKLMQADEDVGKIAQATPTLLGARSCSCFVKPHYGRMSGEPTPIEAALHLKSFSW